MPVSITLQATPNQSLSIQQDNTNYELVFHFARAAATVSITIDGVLVTSGLRFYADTPLIPYAYQEADGGNFVFTTSLDALPDFTEYGVTQFLFYVSAAEVADARA